MQVEISQNEMTPAARAYCLKYNMRLIVSYPSGDEYFESNDASDPYGEKRERWEHFKANFNRK